jgi:hypothetical protein
MSGNIDFTMSNVSGTAVSPIDADSTITATSASNALTFISPIIAPKGPVGELIPVTSANWKRKLGKPYHSKFGANGDGLRCLAEALDACDGFVVRVVPAEATYPAIALSLVDNAVVVANEAVNYSADLTLANGEFLKVGIKDGAESELRSLVIEPADTEVYGEGFFKLVLTEIDTTGSVKTLETWHVSFDPEATDSMGSPAYIQTVLENRSAPLFCVVDSDAAMTNFVSLEETFFTGASNGSIADITADDFDTAIEVIDNAAVNYNCIAAFGIYDSAVQSSLIDMADNKRLMSYHDINPRLTFAEALTAKQGLSLNEPRACYYHFPYTAMCPYHQNKTVWGISGVAVAAKAKGLARTSPTGGWHYTAAGVDHATISRTNLALMKGAGTPDYEAMYTARLNKVTLDESGALFIDDSLTSCIKENYLRFEQVVTITDAISREFDALTKQLKHHPDGVTRRAITKGMKAIFTAYESIDALVPPRNPAIDGTEPWMFAVEQVAIDHWKVTWSICPSGSGRRFTGEPVLIQ